MQPSHLRIEGESGWVSFMRFLNVGLIYETHVFESQDLEIFSKCEVQKRAACEPRILIIECGSHVLSPAFEVQHLVYFYCLQDTDFVFFSLQ